MKLGDQSQIPVEHLARLLLQRAREDDFLLRRLPANDDAPPRPASPRPKSDPVRSTNTSPHVAAHLAALDELVSAALISAQAAEDVSRDVRRQTRRGVAIALALGIAALAMAMAGTVGPCVNQAGQRLAAFIEAAPRSGTAFLSLAAEAAGSTEPSGPMTNASANAAANADRPRPTAIRATAPAA